MTKSLWSWNRNQIGVRFKRELPPVLPLDSMQSPRFFGTKDDSKFPTNETTNSLSYRDKVFVAQFQKLKASFEQDPPVISQGFYPTAITTNGVYMGSTFLEHPPETLPHLFASAILDPKTYCKQSASSTSTISGGDAARRLLRGKRNFRQTMRQELTSRPKDVQKIYILQGHGVPVQLWEHILYVAQTWLQSEESAYEVSVQNVFGAFHFDRMLVRSDSGTSRIAPWPTEWDTDMELYMTVTTRMAKLLSDILRKGDDEGDPPRLKQWNISVQQDFAIPPQLLPPAQELTPTVEFVPMEGQVGRLIIRLQGIIRTTIGDEVVEKPVALIFEGVYDTKQDMRPTNFIW